MQDQLNELNQADLFAQREHMARVKSRIGPVIHEYCVRNVGELFVMEALVRHVFAELGGAPDSPSRILRSLRQDGRIGYTVINRRQSLYRVDWVKAA